MENVMLNLATFATENRIKCHYSGGIFCSRAIGEKGESTHQYSH
jgi:hypothetical protein